MALKRHGEHGGDVRELRQHAIERPDCARALGRERAAGIGTDDLREHRPQRPSPGVGRPRRRQRRNQRKNPSAQRAPSAVAGRPVGGVDHIVAPGSGEGGGAVLGHAATEVVAPEPSRRVGVADERGERFHRAVAHKLGEARHQGAQAGGGELARINPHRPRLGQLEGALDGSARFVVGGHDRDIGGGARLGNRADQVDNGRRNLGGSVGHADCIRPDARAGKAARLPRREQRKPLAVDGLTRVHADFDGDAELAQRRQERALHWLGIGQQHHDAIKPVGGKAARADGVAQGSIAVGDTGTSQQRIASRGKTSQSLDLRCNFWHLRQICARGDLLQRQHGGRAFGGDARHARRNTSRDPRTRLRGKRGGRVIASSEFRCAVGCEVRSRVRSQVRSQVRSKNTADALRQRRILHDDLFERLAPRSARA